MRQQIKRCKVFKLLVLIQFLYSTGLFAQKVIRQVPLQQPGYYRMKLGDIRITALSDGTIDQDLLKLLDHTHTGQVEKMMARAFLQPIMESSVNAYAIEYGDSIILIDTGAGDRFGPTLGKLTVSMQQAGYSTDRVKAILLTHLHPDHIGGLTTGDSLVFPNAKIYVSRAELEHWTSIENKRNATGKQLAFFEIAAIKIPPYQRRGQICAFNPDETLVEGIRPVLGSGHTPGHYFYSLENNGERIVFLGDVLHAAPVQFEDPSVTILYDADPVKATLRRKEIFRNTAASKTWIACAHVSFPGIGHIREEGKEQYTWVPINYSTYSIVR